MKNLSFYLLTFFTIPFFSSCEQEATNVELPETNPKLVVGCFLSPGDSAVVVKVSESNPIFGSNHNNVNTMTLPEAQVVLSDGVNSTTLIYDDIAQDFKVSTAVFPIVLGKTYYLNVSAPNVKSAPVSATCVIPAGTITSASAQVKETGEGIALEVSWSDLPGQKNYYRVFVEHVIANNNGDTIYHGAGGRLQNDEGNDGTTMKSRVYVGYRIGDDFVDWGSGMGDTSKVVAYNIFILNTEANYYTYINSLENYTYDNPFAEPSPIYTNIKDGLGIFAGYNSYQFRKY